MICIILVGGTPALESVDTVVFRMEWLVILLSNPAFSAALFIKNPSVLMPIGLG